MAKVNRFSKGFKKNKVMLSSISLSNGKFRASSLTNKRYATESAVQNLQIRGLMPEHNGQPTTDRMAYEMMHALGYTIETQQENLSLIEENNITIEHENNYTFPTMNMVTKNISMIESFPNECDSIYQADENPPDSLQRVGDVIPIAVAETLDLVSSGFAIACGGMQNTKIGSTTRYFNNQEVGEALKKVRR